MKRRTAPKRGAPPRRRTGLRKKSAKTRDLDRLDDIARDAVFALEGHRCRRCGADSSTVDVVLGLKSIQAAHIYGKGAHQQMRYVLENIFPLCNGCHFGWWHFHGFGREAAPDAGELTGEVRAWCLEVLGRERMERLDYLAAVTKGGRGRCMPQPFPGVVLEIGTATLEAELRHVRAAIMGGTYVAAPC